jgi:thioredoxin reductase (NADPH)
MMYDVLVVGGGPAGLSAALNVTARGKTCAILTNDYHQNPLSKTEVVNNYAGMRGVSGESMLDRMQIEAEQAGAVFLSGRVISILPMDDTFMVAMGSEMVEGKRVILATGTMSGVPLPGELSFIGRGVSYCATCDGMLYRGRRSVVTGDAADLAEEVAFLQRIGVEVTVVTRKPVTGIPLEIPAITAHTIAIIGQDKMEGVAVDEQLVPCDVVFVLREVMAPDTLVSGLKLDGRFVSVNRAQETNIPGLYAAGDCTGKPLQIAKAVGEGLVAAQNAARSL